MLKLRILTAIILIPLVILGILFLPLKYFFALLIIILGLSALEWMHFLHDIKNPRWNYLEVVLLMALGFLAIYPPGWIFAVVGEIWWICVLMWLFYVEKSGQIKPIANYQLRLIACLNLLPFIVVLYVLKLHPAWLLLLLAIVWLTDTAAYFGGRSFGKRKLAPNISPNKTIEGALTAFIALSCFLPLAMWIFSASVNNLNGWIILLFSTGLAAIVGDLFESMLKRQANVKDSGNILPGHGGILDRIDALIAAAPIFFCGLLSLHLSN